MMNNGHIQLNPKRLQEPALTEDLSLFEYDIHDTARQEQFYQAYRSKHVLPSSLMANNYLHMLKKSQVAFLIDFIIAEDLTAPTSTS